MKIVDLSYLKRHFKDIKEAYTVREIIEEAKSVFFQKILANVKILPVETKYIKEVIKKAKEVGVLDYLSRADIKLCALAYKYRDIAIMFTNDLYIQNLCYFLGVKFEGDQKIEYAKIFRYVCPKCGVISERPICPKCGSIADRKVVKALKI
ncbi:MAG TPA: hypothetical protein EYH09_00130 [Candidatus Nanopusillus sp.]|nr:hypothetical protein [Candidatus Nanopusillus sp.]HIP90287.1 hypothetical protein [Candidatus Nanopusillus sp.]